MIVAEKKGLFEQGQVSVHVYSLSPSPIKVRSNSSFASRHFPLPLPWPSKEICHSLPLQPNPSHCPQAGDRRPRTALITLTSA
jgi:hypothetical protein